MPAAVLVLLVLAAIAVDSAVILLAEREMGDAAAAAASDAVVAAIGEERFYTCGILSLDRADAERVAADAVAARRADFVSTTAPDVVLGISAEGVPQVSVTVNGTVDLIFAPTIPGASGATGVSATATATAEQDPTLDPVEGTC